MDPSLLHGSYARVHGRNACNGLCPRSSLECDAEKGKCTETTARRKNVQNLKFDRNQQERENVKRTNAQNIEGNLVVRLLGFVALLALPLSHMLNQ